MNRQGQESCCMYRNNKQLLYKNRKLYDIIYRRTLGGLVMKSIIFICLMFSISIMTFTKNILIINSYSADYANSVNDSLYKNLNKENNVFLEYMNIHQNSNSDNLKNISLYFDEKYKNLKIDLIITAYDSAFYYVKNSSIYENTPMIAYGVSKEESRDNSLIFANSSNYINTLDLILKTNRFKTIYFLNNDKILKGIRLEEKLKNYLKNHKNINLVDINFYDYNVDAFLKTNMDKESVLFIGAPFYKAHKTLQDTNLILTNLPIFTANYDYLKGKNVTGGFMVIPDEKSKLLINSANDLLSGKDFIYLKNFYKNLNYSKFFINIKNFDKYNLSTHNFPQKSFKDYKPTNKNDFIYFMSTLTLLYITVLIALNYYNKHKLYKNHIKISNEKLKKINNHLVQTVEQANSVSKLNKRMAHKMNLLLTSTFDLFKQDDKDHYIKLLYHLCFEYLIELDYIFIYYEDEDKTRSIFGNKQWVDEFSLDHHLKSHKLSLENIIELLKNSLDYDENKTKSLLMDKELVKISINSVNSQIGEIHLYLSKNSLTESRDLITNHMKILTDLFFSRIDREYQVRTAYHHFIEKLAVIAEAHDQDTGKHIVRVGKIAEILAFHMGLSDKKISEIAHGAPIHDIGKIFIPTEILRKKGPLTDREWAIMKTHTTQANFLFGKDKFFETIKNIALYHHEKYDGSGYPYGIKGEEIPIEASIVSLVDIYDALRSKRSYKPGFSHEDTMDIIINGDNRSKPSHFHPILLKVFIENSEDIKEVWESIDKS